MPLKGKGAQARGTGPVARPGAGLGEGEPPRLRRTPPFDAAKMIAGSGTLVLAFAGGAAFAAGAVLVALAGLVLSAALLAVALAIEAEAAGEKARRAIAEFGGSL